MSTSNTINCPSCSSQLQYSTETETWTCPQCGKTFSDQNLLDLSSNSDSAPENPFILFACKECGTEFLCTTDAEGLPCPYCGHELELKGEFSDEFRPSAILPDKIDKQQAIKALKKGLRGTNLFNESYAEKISLFYVPCLNVKGQASMSYTGSLIEEQATSMERKIYSVQGQNSAEFHNMLAAESAKFNPRLVDNVEVFSQEQITKYSQNKVSGMLIERSQPNESFFNTIQSKMESALEYMATCNKNANYKLRKKRMTGVLVKSKEEILVPVWLYQTSQNNEKIFFAVNANSGVFNYEKPDENNEKTLTEMALPWILIFFIAWILFFVWAYATGTLS